MVPGRGRHAAWLAGAGLAAMVALGAAGCASGAAPVVLPPKPAASPAVRATVSVPSVRAEPSERAAIVAAYEGYWSATNRALDTRSPRQARLIMANFVPAAVVSALVRGYGSIWRQNEIGYGAPRFHISKVVITGQRSAAVHDCIDLSGVGLKDETTGQVAGHGQSYDHLITTLEREQGRWLVTGSIAVATPCGY